TRSANEENATSRLLRGSSYPQEKGSDLDRKISKSKENMELSAGAHPPRRHTQHGGSSFLGGRPIPRALRGAISSAQMASFLEKFSRTHTCGEIRDTDVGRRVVLTGWV